MPGVCVFIALSADEKLKELSSSIAGPTSDVDCEAVTCSVSFTWPAIKERRRRLFQQVGDF